MSAIIMQLSGTSRRPIVGLHRNFNFIWVCVQLVATFVGILLTPIVAGVYQRYSISSPVVLIAHFCDLLYAMDALRSFSVGTSMRTTRSHQAHRGSWGGNRLISLIAASSLVIVPVVLTLGATREAAAACSAVRMAVALRFPQLYASLKCMLEDRGMFIHETYIRVVLAFLFAIMHSSLLACVWFYISCHCCPGEMSQCLADPNSWVAQDAVLARSIEHPGTRYLRALHFVIQTLFTIGYGDIHPVNNHEILFTLFLIMNGSLFYAFLISSLTSLLSNRDATTKLFRSEANSIKDLFSSRGASSDASEQLQGYLDFLFSRKRGVLDEAVLSSLPVSLSHAVRTSFAPRLEEVPFFAAIKKISNGDKGGTSDLLSALSARFCFKTFAPGSYLAEQGDADRDLFLILSGRVDVFRSGSRCALMSLRDGDHIGEETMLLGNSWPVTVQASEYTEALVLTHRDMRDAVNAAVGADANYFTKWIEDAAGGEALKAAERASADFHKRCLTVQANMSQTQQKKKIMDMLEQADIGKSLG